MAAIKQRKTKYSVIYWYVNEQEERKQKWGKEAEPMSTIAARSRFAEEPRPQKAR